MQTFIGIVLGLLVVLLASTLIGPTEGTIPPDCHRAGNVALFGRC